MPRKRQVDRLVEQIDFLFDQTLVGGSEAVDAWAAVSALHRRGCRYVFDRAADWTTSLQSLKRERGVQVLCQLRRYKRPLSSGVARRSYHSGKAVYVSESFALVAEVLQTSKDKALTLACLYALMHLDMIEGLPLILPFVTSADSELRLAATHALSSYHVQNAAEAVDALLALMSDENREVRNWATFSLGTQSDADSDEVRAALLALLSDSYFEVRAEAAAALAKRQDLRVLQPLIEMFRTCAYVPISMDHAMRELLQDDYDSRWGADDCIVALRTAFPMNGEYHQPQA